MIWVIAGTKSGREITGELLNGGYTVLATTATDYGARLLGSHGNLLVYSGKKGAEELASLAGSSSVKLIIDASHPYSVEISENAMAAADRLGIPYIRYERESVDSFECVRYKSYAEAAHYLAGKTGNILFTIGTKNMKYFTHLDKKRLYARIAPFRGSLEECESLGIEPGNIMAMSFRFSKNFNLQLYNELDIKFLVTKESGEDGGLMEKIGAALESGIEIILIERPVMNYPEIYYRTKDIIKRTGEILHG